MSLKRHIVQHLRGTGYQRWWEKLAHIAQVGMNHWGGAHFRHSGEVEVVKHVLAAADPRFGTLILDVGADQGFYTEMLLQHVGPQHRVLCFEPSAASRAILARTLAGPLAQGVVSVAPIGLGNAPAHMELFASNDGASVSSLYAFDDHTRPWSAGAKETIEIQTLDTYCAGQGIEHILFMKVDVEGHELAVLQGAQGLIAARAIQFIQFEFGEAHIDARTFFLDIYKVLEPTYTLYRVLPNGLRRIGPYSPDLEVFRTANYLAVLRG